eukprot:3244601-Alexandrium_andersonii.AAC.1
MFIKEAVKSKTITLRHISGKQNPADILTMFYTRATLDAYLDTFGLNAYNHYLNKDKDQLKPEKLQRVNDIKDLSRVVGAVLFLTCFGQADGEDPDNAWIAIAYTGGNFNFWEMATTFLMIMLSLWALRALLVQVLVDFRNMMAQEVHSLSLIHISEPTRLALI